MLIRPIHYVSSFVDALNSILKQFESSSLTRCQRAWLVTVLMGIIVTQSLNWTAFECCSLNQHKQGKLRWMFSHASISWSRLLQASLTHLFTHYQIASGVLVFDDTDNMRAYSAETDRPLPAIETDRNFFLNITSVPVRAL